MEKNQPYKQDKVFDNILETEEFNVYTKIDDLPLDENPMYLEEGINGICTGGSALFNVFGNKRRIVSNDLVVIFPFQLASVTEISSDFSMTFLKVPKSLFMDTISGICIPTLDFFFYMRKNFSTPLYDEECQRFIHFCNILIFRINLPRNLFRRESIMQLLRVFYWDIYVAYKRNPKAAELVKYTRKEKLLFDFFCLVIEFHTVSRDVAFYAKKMCVSAKHLTMVITDMSGRSAKDWIIDYSLLEIKALLRDSDLEIKEVASRTNFQSNSVMTRFFREHTGMTPSEYRERIYVKNEIDLYYIDNNIDTEKFNYLCSAFDNDVNIIYEIPPVKVVYCLFCLCGAPSSESRKGGAPFFD